MVKYTAKLRDGATVECDICIIGSGPAAFSIALQFLKKQQSGRKPIKIVMLESSPNRYEQLKRHGYKQPTCYDVMELYQGVAAGLLRGRPSDYLTTSRVRTYGGTSYDWGGWSWPLKKYNLDAMPPVRPESWPIKYKVLEQYYHEVYDNVMQLPAYEWDDPHYWVKQIKHPKLKCLPQRDTDPLMTRVLMFNPLEFNKEYGHRIHESNDIHVYRNTNALEIQTTPGSKGQKQVIRIMARSIENAKPGRKTYFVAPYYIVAAGAIESTRILLLSDIGNSTGNLGHYFMDHPYYWIAATFEMTKKIPKPVRNFYFNQHWVHVPKSQATIIACLVPTHDFIKKEGIGDFRVMLGAYCGVPGTINTNWEPIPYRDSRISLAEDWEMCPDIFGQKRVKVDWRASPIDSKTAKVHIMKTIEVLKGLGYGKNFVHGDMSESPWCWQEPGAIRAGMHPMGSTRMSENPADGVVDANLRVHDTSNLYVASTSTFPTAGYENPTFTLCALCARLADHLDERLLGY